MEIFSRSDTPPFEIVDDLNTADAMAALFVLVSKVNAALDRAREAGAPPVPAAERDAVLDAVRSMDQALGLLEVARRGRTVDEGTKAWIESKIEERRRARAERDFERADAIRDELQERGIVLEDSAEGTRWKVVGAGATL